jgi:hypothetical protein
LAASFPGGESGWLIKLSIQSGRRGNGFKAAPGKTVEKDFAVLAQADA